LAGSERDSGLLNDHDCSPLQRVGSTGQRHVESFCDVLAPSIRESKQDDAGPWSLAVSCDLTEVQVKRQHDPMLADRLLEDICIGESLKSFVTQMDDVVSCLTQVIGYAQGDAHVGEKAHGLPSQDLFGGKPGCVLECLLHVLGL